MFGLGRGFWGFSAFPVRLVVHQRARVFGQAGRLPQLCGRAVIVPRSPTPLEKGHGCPVRLSFPMLGNARHALCARAPGLFPCSGAAL